MSVCWQDGGLPHPELASRVVRFAEFEVGRYRQKGLRDCRRYPNRVYNLQGTRIPLGGDVGPDGMGDLTYRLFPSLIAVVVSAGFAGCDDGGGSPTFRVTLALKDASGQPADAFPSGQTVTFELTVTNLTNLPQTISFTTGQHYDFLVLNHRKNTIVWQWSMSGVGFTQGFTTLDFQPNEVKAFSVSWDQTDNGANPVSPGAYDAQGYISTAEEWQKTDHRNFMPSDLRTPRIPFTLQ